jgi:hypothetical protein
LWWRAAVVAALAITQPGEGTAVILKVLLDRPAWAASPPEVEEISLREAPVVVSVQLVLMVLALPANMVVAVVAAIMAEAPATMQVVEAVLATLMVRIYLPGQE